MKYTCERLHWNPGCGPSHSLQMSFWLKVLFDSQASECLPPETWPIDGAGSVSFGGYLNQQPKPGGSKVSFRNSAFIILGGMRFQSILLDTISSGREIH